jgi:DNA-binding CsgD family transcriptional regulator
VGRTNREIAQQLFLSENTVESHLAHVYRKLGIRRRWELIAQANA